MVLGPYVYINIFGSFISILVAIGAWQRKNEINGGRYLTTLMLLTTTWSFAAALELALPELTQKLWSAKIQYISIPSVPLLFLLYSIEYNKQGWRLNKYHRIYLSIIPIITMLLAFTNDWHHLIWTSYAPSTLDNNIIIYKHGVWFWIGTVGYAYLMTFFGTLIFFYGIKQRTSININQITLIVTATLAPWVLDIIYLFGWGPIPGLDLAPLSMAFSGAMLILAVLDELRDRLLQKTLALESVVKDLQKEIKNREILEQNLQNQSNILQETNTRLENALQTKDEFLAAMSHELRTPLTSFLGSTQLLKSKELGNLSEYHLRTVDNLIRSGNRLSELITDVLDYSKLQSGTFPVYTDTCSVATVCRIALIKINEQTSKKMQRVHFSTNLDPIYCEIDEKILTEILRHLLDNASKFTPEQKDLGIEIVATLENKIIKITVWDHGIGIEAENYQRIFQTFVQLDGRLSRKYTGTGLGLALVQEYSYLLGGSINMESIPAQGSRFTLTIPWIVKDLHLPV